MKAIGRPLHGPSRPRVRAFGRVYAGWAMSQAFYRRELWRDAGFASLEDYLVRAWEGNFLRRDAADLISMIDTWTAFRHLGQRAYSNGDLAAGPRCDHGAGDHHALDHGPLFHGRRQRSRDRADAQRRIPPDPVRSGATAPATPYNARKTKPSSARPSATSCPIRRCGQAAQLAPDTLSQNSARSFERGNGVSGVATPRNSQSAPQPWRTSNRSSRSGGISF